MAHATLTSTLASALMAPPSRRLTRGAWAAIWVGGALLVLAFLVVVGGGGGGALVLAVPGGLIAVLGGMSLADVERYNVEKLPPLLAEWRRKWVCLTCGTVFVPASAAPAGAPAPGVTPGAGPPTDGRKLS